MIDLIERARSKSPYLSGSSAERLINELADEIERLRAALEELTTKITQSSVQMHPNGEKLYRECIEITRRALEPKP